MPDTSLADRMKAHQRDWLRAQGYSDDLFEPRWPCVLTGAAGAKNLF